MPLLLLEPTRSAREAFVVIVRRWHRWAVRGLVVSVWWARGARLGLILAGGAVALPVLGATSEGESRDFSRPIIVGAVEASYPYSHIDAAGRMQGFAVEVTDALARTMNLPLRRAIVTNVDMAEQLRSGAIDVVQFWTETPARREFAAFSVPLLRLETVVVKRRGDDRIRSLDDLRGRVVGVGVPGTVAERFMREQHPDAIIRNTRTAEDFLRGIEVGSFDAGVLSRLTALSMIDHYGLKNVEVLEDRVTGYDVRYAYAVRPDDTELLARLNEGLAILHRTGEFDAIYERWFGRYERPSFTRVEVLTAAAITLLLGLVAAVAALLRQNQLTRRIARQSDELEEQRHLLGALFDSHPLATFVLEREAEMAPRVLSLNREAGLLCGLDPAEVAGRRIDELTLAPEIRAYFDELVQRWPQGGFTQQHDTHLRDSQRLIETSLVSLGVHGAAERLCVLSHDVTKRRLGEREIAQARRVRALGELVGGIAHEFNNLLTPVIMKAGFMREDYRHQPALTADLQVIEEAARRAAELTRRLLTFGRRGEDRTRLVRLDEALENCLALLRTTVDRRIEWHTAVPAGLPPIACQATDLHQIIFNLVLNARDTLVERLTREAGTGWQPRLSVVVTTHPAAAFAPRAPRPGATLLGWQRLTVSDNGEGIPPEALDRVFEPFFTTKDVGKGTGLGLATVWHLAAEAGGFVAVESRTHLGSEFHVTLPAWSVEPVSEPREPAAGETPARAAGSRAPFTATGLPAASVSPQPVSAPAETPKAAATSQPMPAASLDSCAPERPATADSSDEPGPASVSPVSAAPIRAPQMIRCAASSAIGAGRHVLLVEDEALVARTTRLLLERTGHRVTHVSDGPSALRALSEPAAHFDVLLIDINMPGMTGVEVVSQVRAGPYAGRIVVMSGRVAEQDLRALDSLHVDYVLPKPFMLQQLLEALQAAPVGAAV